MNFTLPNANRINHSDQEGNNWKIPIVFLERKENKEILVFLLGQYVGVKSWWIYYKVKTESATFVLAQGTRAKSNACQPYDVVCTLYFTPLISIRFSVFLSRNFIGSRFFLYHWSPLQVLKGWVGQMGRGKTREKNTNVVLIGHWLPMSSWAFELATVEKCSRETMQSMLGTQECYLPK